MSQIIASAQKVCNPMRPGASIDLKMTAIAYNDWDPGTRAKGRPVGAAFGGTKIFGNERGCNFNLGGEFTENADRVKEWLCQGLGEGGGEPEELTGALLAASHLRWDSDVMLVVAITDAPCHGTAYSNASPDSFCDTGTGLSCTSIPEVPLEVLKANRVKVVVLHPPSNSSAVSQMCQKLSSKGLIGIGVDTSMICDRMVPMIKAELEQVKPKISYLLQPLTFDKPTAPGNFNLAAVHEAEIEEGGKKEVLRIGSLDCSRALMCLILYA